MRALKTQITIAARPEQVWQTLADIAAYPDWNPQIFRIEGTLAPDQPLRLAVQRPRGRGKPLLLSARVKRVESPRVLEWEGGVRGIFMGRHRFTLESTPNGTLLRNEEEMRGLLPWILGPRWVASLKPAYEAMNQALAHRVESLSGSGMGSE